MFADLINHHIAPLLSDAGFDKRGLTWNRATAELVQVLDVQKREKRKDGSVVFTLNLGLWIEPVWRCCWGEAIPKFIKETDCFPRFRVGFLLEDFVPRFCDKWWFLADGQDITMVGSEIYDVIQHGCLPFFGTHRSVSQAFEFATGRLPVRLPLERLYLAILQSLEGKSEDAERSFSELAADPHWGQRVKVASSRLRNAGTGFFGQVK